MITETLRDKLRKVLALAQSGQAGERDAAKNLLDRLLKENNLTIDDISNDSVEVHWFKTGRNADMNDLLAQIYFMVTDTHETTTYRSPARKGCIGFKVTAVQAADMEAYYSVLAPALRKEMNRYRRLVVDSFCQKHELFARSEGPHRDLSPEEIAYLRKVSLFQNAIDKVDFRRQIES